MGYYSFYKIFKDIIKTIFGKRFFRIFLIVLIIILIGTKVFASFTVTADNGTVYTLPDNTYSHLTIIKYNGYWSGSYCGVIFYNGNINFTTVSANITYSITSSDNATFGHILGKSSNTIDFSNYTLSNTSSLQQDLKNLEIIYSNGIVYKDNNVIYEPVPDIKYPEIVTTVQDLETLNYDVISINAWDFSEEDIDVLFYDLNYGTDTTDSLYPKTVITLNQDTTYFQENLSADPTKNAIYWIPNTETGLNFVKGGKYAIRIAKRNYGVPRWWWI